MRPETASEVFTREGISDPLQWLRDRIDVPFHTAVADLQPGLPPIEVEGFCQAWALDRGRFAEFARLRAANRIRERFSGIDLQSERAFVYANACAWSSWAGLFDPVQVVNAEIIWQRLKERVKDFGWLPQSDSDPDLLACFEGMDLEPTAEAVRYRQVWDVIAKQLAPAGYDTDAIVASLCQLPRGYLLLYAFESVDSQVCNGGFDQLLHNRYGALLGPAAAFARLLQLDAMADVITAAGGESPDLRALSDEYFRLRRLRGRDELTKARWLFPSTHPEYFEPPAADETGQPG